MAGASHLARGALLGLVGGLVAAGAMSLAHQLANQIAPKAETPPTREKDSTVQVASVVTRQVGYELPKHQESRAGSIVHFAFGGLIGALYGAVAEAVPKVTALVGLPFGVALWLGAHVMAVPALGLAEPPNRKPAREETMEFGLHAVYGMTTELVRRLLLLVRPI